MMTIIWLSLISTICFDIIKIAYADTNCTYLQGELEIGNKKYLAAYVPYICMSYGRTHYTNKDAYHTHIDKSIMFSCETDGELRFDEYNDGDCEHKDPSTTTNLNTGDRVDIDGNTLTIRDFRCDNTSRN
eukprot:787780_1